MKILIIEDESLIAEDLKESVTDFGYEVVGTVRNYENAAKIIKETHTDILLMDINIDGESDGIEASKKLNIPTIFLTAYVDEDTLERAAMTEPLGYLIKPFVKNELKAVLKLSEYKLTKQSEEQNTDLIYFGDGYCFNEKESKLYFEDFEIDMTKNERKLLELLVKLNGNTLTYDVMDYEIWPKSTVTDSARRTLIYRLNSKLNHKVIKSVAGIGYKINLNN